jgi:hypothetical protein
MPGVYGTSASQEVSVSRSQGSVSWTEIYTLQSVSPTEVTLRSYGSASVTATYSGPLPGTFCYDGRCQQAAPGYYTAPPQQVVNTWTQSYTESCPAGYTGSVTVIEQWRTVRYWSPSAGGSPRGGPCASPALPGTRWWTGRLRTTARRLTPRAVQGRATAVQGRAALQTALPKKTTTVVVLVVVVYSRSTRLACSAERWGSGLGTSSFLHGFLRRSSELSGKP